MLLKPMIFFGLILMMGCIPEADEMKYPETKKDTIRETIFGQSI